MAHGQNCRSGFTAEEAAVGGLDVDLRNWAARARSLAKRRTSSRPKKSKISPKKRSTRFATPSKPKAEWKEISARSPDEHPPSDRNPVLPRTASPAQSAGRGQRTHTNARTRKGPRKGAVAAKKKVAARSKISKCRSKERRSTVQKKTSVAKEPQTADRGPAGRGKDRPSARRNSRKSANARSCLTEWPAFRPRSTTPSSP